MLNESDKSRVIEMAWEDRTPFEAIERLYGIDENLVIALMRKELKHRAFVYGVKECLEEKPNIRPYVAPI